MYKQAKDLQKRHDLEDAKNHAADNVLNKYVQGSTEIDKLSQDIANAGSNKRKDNFTGKYALICCNAIYINNTGMGNLSAVYNDHKTVSMTAHMMGIEKDNIIDLVDANHA